jgi:hypothetical protein
MNFLIWSNEHAAWWRPSACGYTKCRPEAGQYNLAEATRIVHEANFHLRDGEEPNETMVLADYELAAERNDLKADFERAYARLADTAPDDSMSVPH